MVSGELLMYAGETAADTDRAETAKMRTENFFIHDLKTGTSLENHSAQLLQIQSAGAAERVNNRDIG